MRKNNRDFQDIEILKERQRLRILEQEIKLKSDFKDLANNLTFNSIKNRVITNLIDNSSIGVKLGLTAISLLSEKLKRKRRK
jgi:hypothetical protein